MKHIPFTRIRGQCEDLPDSFDSCFFDIGSVLDDFPVDIPEARPFFDSVLESKFSEFEVCYRKLSWLLSSRFEVPGCSFGIYREAIQRGNRQVILLNKRELYARSESFEIQAAISEAKVNFIKCYIALIEYLRFHYTEIDLDSYEPYQW